MQDCQVTKEIKEREAHLGHLDNRDLLDLTEPLGVLEVLATQVSPVLQFGKVETVSIGCPLPFRTISVNRKIQF